MRVNWVVDVQPDGWAVACRVLSLGKLSTVSGPITGPYRWVMLLVRADLDAGRGIHTVYTPCRTTDPSL